MADVNHDLERFDDDFKPQQNQSYRLGLDTVTDGAYNWTILSAALDRTPKTNDDIVRVELRCEPTGLVVEHVYFLREQDHANRLGGDLAMLGFDVTNWTKANHRPFSQEIVKALPALRGRRFHGVKKTNTTKETPPRSFHNLFLQKRLDDADAAALPAAATPTGTKNRDEIPF